MLSVLGMVSALTLNDDLAWRGSARPVERHGAAEQVVVPVP